MSKRILAVMMAFVMLFSCMPVFTHAVEAAPAASGTTYYVSSLHGAEGNNGTSQSTPFASLLKINEITLQPGDRVLLERGSVFVDEYLWVQGSGSAEAPIIIDAYGDESQPKPLIQTNGKGLWYQDYGKRLDNTLHQYYGYVSSCIRLYDVEYIEISNIAMTNEGHYDEGEVYNSLSRYDRTGVAGIAENIGTVDHIYLRDLDIRNVEGHVRNKHMANGGIYLLCHMPDNESLTGPAKFDDVLIEGCRLDEVNRWGIAVGYTAHWDEFQYASTIDPYICQTYGSTNVVIRNNYLTNIGGDGITTMYCYQPLMEYNVLDGYCQDMVTEIYGPSDGQMVAAGIWPWMCKTAVMQYNEAYNSTANPDGQAWDADYGDNAIYQYNYSCNNAGGAVMFCGTYACNTVFRYNISQNDLAGVLNLASSPNGEIYNNVFYIKEGVKVNRTGMSGGRNNTISNNIFYYTGSTPANAAYGNWGDIGAQWNSNIYYNYETTPDDPGAITADPLFVDPGKAPTGAQASGLVHDISVFEGYKLQSDSPAINAGTPIEDNGGRDFFGNELDLIPDIGAYEAGTFQSDASKLVVVDVELGESVTVTDYSGDYSDTTPTVDNEKIASVVLTGKGSVSQTTVSSTAATELVGGKDYMICNSYTGSAVTNVEVDAPAWGTRALDLTGDKTVSALNTWTLEGSNGSFKLRDSDGKYLSIDLNASTLNDGESFTAARSGNSWTFCDPEGYYMDNLGSLDFLGGWIEAGTNSTWNLYEIITASLDGTTELTFTGLFPGTANIVVGDTLYRVRVSGNVQEVALNVGETATFTDDSGNYTNADTSSLDKNVATVELTGLLTDDYSLGSKVTSLANSGKYILVNTRANKPVTNLPTNTGNAVGLLFSGAKEDAAKNTVWTITSVSGGYTIQDQDGMYMTVGADSSAITAVAHTLDVAYNGSTWTISENNAYLNQHGGSSSTCAAGWENYAAPTDSGSQWEIYQVNAGTDENGTTITFTAVGGGETQVLIGEIMYHIVVTGDGHGFVNGFCDHCNEYQSPELVDGVYQIGNAGQLYWFAKLVDGGELDADAVLTADITVNADGEERKWNAIGSSTKKYAGTFDGRGFTVSGLFYDNDSTVAAYIGLIASLDETGVVKNVTVADSYLCGYRYIGAIVGSNNGGVIENCHNDGSTVMGSGSNIGGIAGGSTGSVTGCSNSGEISSDAGNNIGGIVGGSSGTVELCFNTGAVISDCCSDEHCVGGIVGENMSGTIRNCYNAGDLSNKGAASGGIAGKSDRGILESCHNVGSVSGKKDVDGIIGKSYNTPAVTNCYQLTDGTAAQFASGEITYLLNGSTSDGELVWKQTLGIDAYPRFEGAVVYYNDATDTYSNASSGDVCAHTPGEAVRENETPATCTEAGSYDSVVYCSKCGEELSRQTVEIPATGHNYENGSCTGCGKAQNPFVDVPEGSFYYDAVLWAVENGITTGVSENHFNPTGDCNRAQAVTFLWRAMGEPAHSVTENPFVDVPADSFYYNAVMWAVENGITTGIDSNHFGPTQPCIRAQVVTFLWRAVGKPEADTEVTFTDVQPGVYYYDAVAWAVENGITVGTGSTFNSTGTCNRAQMVTFLYRAMAD